MIRTVRSHAKINTFLFVTGRREDGYHDLHTFMTLIRLHDDLSFDFSGSRIKVRCDHPDVPEDDTNLVCRAAQLFFDETGIKNKGVCIHITKKIPPGGGLGGGSSNAAQTLKVLNDFFCSGLTLDRLKKLGLMLGADVPFFIQGRPAIAQGVGERLIPVENQVLYYIVMCDPGIRSSTARVYKNIDFRLTESQKYTINSGLSVPTRGQKFDAGDCLHNDLEDSACKLYPEIKDIKEEMELLLNKRVNMTGSGSSLFALYSDRQAAERGIELLTCQWAGMKQRVFLSSFL